MTIMPNFIFVDQILADPIRPLPTLVKKCQNIIC